MRALRSAVRGAGKVRCNQKTFWQVVGVVSGRAGGSVVAVSLGKVEDGAVLGTFYKSDVVQSDLPDGILELEAPGGRRRHVVEGLRSTHAGTYGECSVSPCAVVDVMRA